MNVNGWDDLRPFVQKLAIAMEEKLRKNDHKNRLFIDDPTFFLPAKLNEEVSELLMDPCIEEAADVCNVAGMVATLGDSDLPSWTITVEKK